MEIINGERVWKKIVPATKRNDGRALDFWNQ
jgi:hypothetical protein